MKLMVNGIIKNVVIIIVVVDYCCIPKLDKKRARKGFF